MADEQIEVPVLVKVKADPEGTVFGIGRFSGVFGRVFGAIQRHPWVLAVTAVVGFIGKAVNAQKLQQAAVNSLNQALIQQGIYTRDLSQSYQDMALAIQSDTQYSDQEVIQAQANLQSYLGDKVITKDLMRAVTDFASVHKMDLGQAADMFGKAIGTGTNALVKYVIRLEDGMTRSEKLAAVQGQVNSRWGGQAQASAQGLGAIKQMQNALGGVMEVFGKILEPWISILAKEISSFATSLKTSGQAAKILDVVGVVIQGLVNHFKLTIWAVLEQTISAIGFGMKFVTDVVKGRFEEAFELLFQREKRGVDAAKETTKQAIRDVQGQKRDEAADGRNKALFKKIQTNQTAAKKAELEEGKKKESQLSESEIRTYELLNKLGLISDREQLKISQSALQNLSDLRNSKFGAQIAIGKTAAIAMIGINTAAAIAGIWASIGWIPIFGWIAATILTVAMIAWAGEQTANIIGSSIDNPGRIGEGSRPEEMAEGGIVTHSGMGTIVSPLRGSGLNFRSEVNVTILGGLVPSQQEAKRIAGLISNQIRYGA